MNVITSFALDPVVDVGAVQISYLYPIIKGDLSSSNISIL